MKKVFLLLFFLSALQSFSQTNVYHPFPKWDSQPLWRVDKVNYEQIKSPVYDYRQYQFTGDTVVGQYTYQKINISGITNYLPTSWVFYSYYYGSIREDTVSKKVFYLENQSYRDTLLYDFSLNIGDTLSPAWNVHYPYDDVVEFVDSVLIDSEYRRRMRVSDAYIIEGIGSTTGLLEPLNPFENYNELICFSQNGLTLYPDTISLCDMLIEDVVEISNNNFSIYPNPASTTITVEAVNSNQYSVIKMYNAQGQLVFTSTFDIQRSIFDISSLPSGIYYLTLSNAGQTVSRKFVKE